uniref:Chromosome 2 open reading frame 74 n=1 Tax=Myotis lucifugus TaxID=59463 RepID=G1Q567_MYOLU
ISLLAEPMSSDTTAIIFVILLLICFTSILFLLMLFIYKCFQRRKTEETENGPCEDCLTDNVQTSNPRDQENFFFFFSNLQQIMRPGILVHRPNKEMEAAYLKNNEDIEGGVEGEIQEEPDPEGPKENSPKDTDLQGAHMSVTGTPSVIDNSKRPLKGVTFSREVIVVDLGEKHPAPQSHIQEHKERK